MGISWIIYTLSCVFSGTEIDAIAELTAIQLELLKVPFLLVFFYWLITA